MRNVILLFLLIVGWTTTVYAQNEQETIEVTGIVTDPKNEPLIGVNVTARNMPGFGAITDQGSQLLLLDFFLCGIYKAGNLYQRQKNH